MIKENEQSKDQSFVCPACGAVARRSGARFCHTCGRRFATDAAYLPTDALRASYHLQQYGSASRAKLKPAPHRSHSFVYGHNRKPSFTPSQNSIAALALASVAYALIPFLGILFCPGAILFGGWGAVRARNLPGMDGRRAALFSVCAGILIFVAQLLLCWMLSRIPQWATL
jgi:ribosomal protein L37AE/L43A